MIVEHDDGTTHNTHERTRVNITPLLGAPEPYRRPPEIPLNAIQWRDSSEDDDRSRLLGTIIVAGCYMHLEAYEMIEDEDGVQQFRGSYGESADQVYAAISAEGPWETVEMNGRHYVLIATPHCT